MRRRNGSKQNKTEIVDFNWSTGHGMGIDKMWSQYLTSFYWSCHDSDDDRLWGRHAKDRR